MNNLFETKREPRGWADQLHEASQVFLRLAALTLSVLVILATALLLQMKLMKEPVLSLKGLSPNMSSVFFTDMVRMELPALAVEDNKQHTFSNNNVLFFLLQVLTDINPRDPKSLLAGEVPGIQDDTIQLRKGIVAGENVSPADYAPPDDIFNQLPDNTIPTLDDISSNKPNDQLSDKPNEPTPVVPQQNNAPSQTTNGKKVIFIYHSHDRESWLPELKAQGVTDINKAYDAKMNITLVGKRLQTKLEDLGIGASHSSTDYPTVVKNYNWNFSYKYSHETVVSALAANPKLTYFIDIHRDSQRRELTTTTINGKAYAQVYFIIGHLNPNWSKNEQFANKIHEALQDKYPNLSRGIWGKGANNGNGEYNQSISPNSILIEIGGPENTLEESNRTADVLAKVIADIYWQAEKVNADG